MQPQCDSDEFNHSQSSIEQEPSHQGSDQRIQMRVITVDEPSMECASCSSNYLFKPLAAIEVFLAPVTLISGSMASHEASWNSIFAG